MSKRNQTDDAGNGAFRSLIDLGTASVKTLVVELGPEQTHVWGHGQSPLEDGYGPDGRLVDRQAVAAACDAALSAAEEMTGQTFGHKIVPDRSLWSVPGWLCRGQTVAFQRQRPQPARRISPREWSAWQARLDRAVAQLAGAPLDVAPTVRLNGHTVTDAVGLTGKTLALHAFVASADADALAALGDVAAALELDPPRFVSQARAAAVGLPHDGVLLDVGRWGTHLTVARLGQPAGAAWTPLGGQSFYRTLSNSFDLAPSRLSDFCRAYSDGHLPAETALAADAILADPVARWLDLVLEQLIALAADGPLPHQVYLAGGASALPAVLQGARRYDWMRRFPWPRRPEIHPWPAASVGDLTNHTGRAWQAADLIGLGLARLANDIG